MTSDEIRAAFLHFFEEKGHKVIPSSSLIPHGDPTLLLTTAGMVQFKPYFLGELVPPAPRLASCQKSFRTTDIERVGDANHLTFFEMLGNFSIGDYFKKEAIAWAWEFVTERLRLPLERLRITIFTDDDESYGIWRKIGIPDSKITRLGEKENFWGPAGNSGPCGPCSEIHYDFGEAAGCGKPGCAPGCDCGRFSEIWNLVFTQYNQDEAGNRTPLPKPNIDTGMGLERTAVVVQGKRSVYETDFFADLIQKVCELSGKEYASCDSTDIAVRIVAEHSRGLTFLISDGVIPANEGRGYVLRRLLRRAALFGKRLGLDKPFLSETARVAIAKLEHVYPELKQRRGFILKVIELEEARFSETLSTGLTLLDEIMEKVIAGRGNTVSGQDSFKLYDTYGFPVELTREIAAGRGLSVDSDGFEKEMEAQREKARAAHKFGGSLKEKAGLNSELNVKETPFVGYKITRHNSVIISLLVNNESVDTVKEGQEASLILESTPFYGEMGGQIGDAGQIRASSGQFQVSDAVHVPPNIIVHQGKVSQGELSVGDEVEAEVDSERRLDIARNHTATHLLQFALRHVLGEHVQQRGSLVAPDRFRFDFSHLTGMTREEIEKVQRIVNEKSRQNLRVYDEVLPYKKAVAEGAIALFDEKYGDTVRVMKVGAPAISQELCGGTHVNATGEIGFFRIISESSIGAGLRRIEAVTGRGAEAFSERQSASLEKVARNLGARPEEVEDKASDLVTELDKERKEKQALEKRLSKSTAESLVCQAEIVKGVRVLVARVPPTSPEVLREMSDLLKEQLKSAVIVLGTVYQDRPAFLAAVTPDLIAKGYDAGKLVREVAKVAGGGGGGKPGLAQAGGKDKDKLDEALQRVKSLI